jgi:serine/threonine protein kinase
VKKINKDKMAIDPIYDELMKEEIAILSNISHPNLMRVYELLQDYDHIYIVTEYIKGGELQETLKRIKKFEEEKAALIIY